MPWKVFFGFKEIKKKWLDPCSVMTWLKGNPESSMLSRPGVRLLGLNFCHGVSPSRGCTSGSFAFLAATSPFLEKRLFWKQVRSQNRSTFLPSQVSVRGLALGARENSEEEKESPPGQWVIHGPWSLPVGHVLTSAFCKQLIFKLIFNWQNYTY